MDGEFSRARTADGQTFVYRDGGSGPLVVLIHGFPDTPFGWDTIAGRLTEAGYRTVAPWLRGYHPETKVHGRGYGALVTSMDAIRLLDALQEESAVIAGHDWGASIAYGAASLAPGRVRAIVPIAIPHPSLLRPTPAALWQVRHFLALRLPWAERSVARGNFAYIDTLYHRWAPRWSGPDRDECVRHAKECFADPTALTGALGYYRALSPRLPGPVAKLPTVPALVVGGTEDIGDPSLFERTAGLIGRGSQALVVAGAGHWPHREAEDRFAEALIGFLGALSP